jgi:hypothetical protein
MTWITLLTNCSIAGVFYGASDDPIHVSSSDAKTLIAMRYAKPAQAPEAAPVAKRPKAHSPSES